MSEQVEITVKLIAYSETHGTNAEALFRPFEAKIIGTLKSRGSDYWKGATSGSPDTFRLGPLSGTVHLLMHAQDALAEEQGYILEHGIELQSDHPVLDARATMTEGEVQGDWNILDDPDVNDWGLLGLHFLARTMDFEDADLVLDGGPWRVWLFEVTDPRVE